MTAHEAMKDPETRLQGIELAAACGNSDFAQPLETYAEDAKQPIEVRVAAVEALGAIRAPGSRAVLNRLIAATKGDTGSDPVAEAAVRTVSRLQDSPGHIANVA